MFLIIGLGNPGEKYKNTRHNIGFLTVDEFTKETDLSDFKFSKKNNALISTGFLEKERVIAAKPQTFMNLSGKSVKSLAGAYKISIENIIVVHDDVDLPIDKIRVSKGRGTAGHKGAESIVKELRTNNFIRIRTGIRPQDLKPKKIESFVLKKFKKEEGKIVKKITKKACLAIKTIIREGLDRAMTEFNQ